MGLLERFFEAGVLNHVEVEFARLLARCANFWDETALLMCALACRAPRVGDICVDVKDVDRIAASEDSVTLSWPPLDERLRAVKDAPFIGAYEEGKEPSAPLVLEENRLYLYRYYKDEVSLARNVLKRASTPSKGIVCRVFYETIDDSEVMDVCKRFESSSLVIITGGAGTGKTTLASKIVGHLVKNGVDPQAIWAVAPTGRASARLGELLGKHVADILGFQAHDKANVRPGTIHRTFGIHPDSPFVAKYNPQNPAPVEVVVIDECSMVDLVTMTRVFEALPEDCIVILLGDADQLASVEAGSVFRDLCSATTLSHIVSRRERQYRSGSAIMQSANLVRQGSKEVLGILLRGGEGLHYDNASSPDWLDKVVDMAVQEYNQVINRAESGDDTVATHVVSSFRVLCALRRGKYGCEAINALVRQRLGAATRTWFPGRVIMVTENDPKKGLFNGDVGVAIRDKDGRLKVVFPDYSGESSSRYYEPFSLPEHEDAFATTIHKAQGSEADKIVLVLPPEDSRILSRELLYTGLTRAKEGLWIFANQEVISRCLERSIQRVSGLTKKLEGNTPAFD